VKNITVTVRDDVYRLARAKAAERRQDFDGIVVVNPFR